MRILLFIVLLFEGYFISNHAKIRKSFSTILQVLEEIVSFVVYSII
jgi:hypothetical protein